MKKIVAELIFWLHFLMVGAWYGLFFVPTSLWSEKIAFHFFFTLFVVGHQFVWGGILSLWTKRYKMACILTTPMQILRGYPISDERNYNHSCIKEFFARCGLRVPKRAVTFLTFATLLVVTIQYFIFR